MTLPSFRHRTFVRAGCALAFACGAAHAALADTPTSQPDRHRRKPAGPVENLVVHGTLAPAAPIRPAGQTTYSAERRSFADHAALSVADMVATIPGVSVLAGNGPRDTIVSVRGSGARQSYGLKNLQVLEDGFPVTQPDGTARSDLIDPHAYAGVDVFEGPASTVYGNYAINGAIDFRTRNGADIDGVELGSDFGSFGLVNNYASAGFGNAHYDLAVFASDVRADGSTANARYNTSTENLKLNVNLGPSDRLTLKFINNITDAMLPIRLSLAQYHANPYQQGCGTPASLAAGCATVSLLVNGAYGSRQAITAQAAGLGRFDRRTLVGLGWTHDFNAATTWRNMFTYDQRHVDQPTSTTAFTGPYNSYAYNSDITNIAHPGIGDLTSFAGVDLDYLDYGAIVYNLTPQGGATRGALNSTTFGHQWNIGARAQEDWHFAPKWHFVIGLGGTYSDVAGVETIDSYAANAAARTFINANRFYFNLAPEAALIYAPSQTLTLHTRVGTAYATPSSSNLFITPRGTYGNNTQLKSETSVGIDLGAQWRPTRWADLQATGFYEFYANELVSQSAGVNTVGSYTFNAPASQHRGIELSATLTPLAAQLPGGKLVLNYTNDDQRYTNYTETLSNSTRSASFSRTGNQIPGVIPNFLDGRVLYDQPDGRLEGFGGFAEVVWRGAYFLDNANILKAPAATTLNVELHYDPPQRLGWVHRLHVYFEVQNVANTTYIAGATNISDVLLPGGTQAGAAQLSSVTGSIYAGAPRSFIGGLRVKL